MLRHLCLVLVNICLMAIAIAACAHPGGGLAVEDAQIVVMEVVNRVETHRPGHQELSIAPTPLSQRSPSGGHFLARVGQELIAGDAVKTYPDSEARIDIAVREFLRVTRTTPNSVWRLGEFTLAGSSVIELEQGKIFLFDEGFQEGQPPVQVVTPAGTASPRGTWLSVEYDPETGVTRVRCFRGECELSNDLGSLVLVDEQESSMTPETAPSPPQAMSREDLQAFTQLPEARSGEIAVPAVESPRLAREPEPELEAAALVVEPAADDLEEAVEQEADDANNAVDDVAESVDEAVDDVTNTVDDAVDDVAEALDEAVNEVTNTVDDAVDDVAEALDGAVGDVTDAVDDAVDDVAEALDEAVGDVAEAVDDAVDDAQDAVDDVSDAVDDAVDDAQDAVDDVSDAVDDAVDDAQDAVDDVSDAVDDAVDDAGDAVDDAVDDVLGGL